MATPNRFFKWFSNTQKSESSPSSGKRIIVKKYGVYNICFFIIFLNATPTFEMLKINSHVSCHNVDISTFIIKGAFEITYL